MPQLQSKEKSVLESLREYPTSFWIDSSGGPSHLCNLSMAGTDPKYIIYGSLNETNRFDFLEEKIKEEKSNKDGIFVGYISYDMDFFFAYFDKTENITNDVIARKDEVLTKQSPFVMRYEIASLKIFVKPLHRIPPFKFNSNK